MQLNEQYARSRSISSVVGARLTRIYNFDSNSIHVKPLKSRHDNDTIKAYEDIYNMLTRWGLKPQLHWLDNEASKALKNFIDTEQTKYQLTPPHIHQRNAAE